MLWLCSLLLAQEPLKFRFARLDIVSEEPGFWLHDQAPLILSEPLPALTGWLSQVKVVMGTPVLGLTVGASVESQSLHYERSVFGFQSMLLGGGIQTSLGLPRGVWLNVAYQRGYFRGALALSTVTEVTWWDMRSPGWRFLPTIGIGFGPG